MRLNKDKIIQYMKDNFANSNNPKDEGYNAFARELGVDISQLYKTLNDTKRTGGAKLFGALITHFQKKNIDYTEYIFLGSPLEKSNERAKKIS